MSGISTHVLDTARGCPAAGVGVTLERRDAEGWRMIGRGETNADGRIGALMGEGAALDAGEYRLTFATGEYFRSIAGSWFYPSVTITFEAAAGQSHYHVPT